MQRVRCVEIAWLSLIQRLNGEQVETQDVRTFEKHACPLVVTAKQVSTFEILNGALMTV